MKQLTIVVPNGQNNLSSIVGAYKIFTRANEVRKRLHGSELFTIQLAGTADEVEFYDGLFSVKPHLHFQAIETANLIIIPSLNHNYHSSVAENAELVRWIETQYKKGAEVASICTGAFLLAASGLLDGKSCSTHWAAAEAFRELFPKVHLQTDELITDENGIYTNGGAYSFLNLMIYLVEKYYDRSTALYCAKVFQIEIDRHSQSEFAMFVGQKSHSDEMVKEAQAYIEERPDAKISVAELSSKFCVGRRNFDRRFIKATGNTPIEYVQRVKVEQAKRSLESTRKTVNEVMYDVGYTDLKAFREVFKKITGISPLDYRTKYNKDAQLV